MADLIYDFSHEIGAPSFDIITSTARISVRYIGANPKHSETASSNEVMMGDILDGVSVRHRLDPYVISSEFEMEEATEIGISLTFSSSVTVRGAMPSNPGVVSAIDARGNTIMSIIASRMMDDTGMASPVVNISSSGDGSEWTLTMSADEDWASSSSRVSPFRFSVDYSMSPPSKVAMSSIRMASIDNETVLYQDTRPDAATMFAVYLCDDSQFKRERMMSEGRPVCSTIPHIEGDTWDLVEADFDRHELGYGYDTRRVWLEIIASKPVPIDKPVYYDVIPPGTVQYLGNIAERIGTIGGLPIFRGSFVVTKNSPPSFQDGTGVVRVYIIEERLKDIKSRIRVVGSLSDSRSARVKVIDGTRRLTNRPARVTVVNHRTPISGRVRVLAQRAKAIKEARVLVNQPNPPDEFVYDGKFAFSNTLATRWDEPHWTMDYAGTSTEVASPVAGETTNVVKFVEVDQGSLTSFDVDWSHNIGVVIQATTAGDSFGGYMAALTLHDVPAVKSIPVLGSLKISFRYLHLKRNPPYGTEWSDDWGAHTTWDVDVPQGLIGVRVNGYSTGGNFTAVRAWSTHSYGHLAPDYMYYMQRPSFDATWQDVSFYATPSLATPTTLTSVTFMFVPKYCLTRSTSWPYSGTGWPGVQMADLYLDNISVKVIEAGS